MVALLLAWTWCSGVWHEDLEAAGWMFEYDHAHAGHGDHASGPASDDASCPVEDEHLPVWARGVPAGGVLAALNLLLLVTAFLAATWVLGFRARLLEAGPSHPPKWRRMHFEPLWSFARRCAPDAVAPPVLG